MVEEQMSHLTTVESLTDEQLIEAYRGDCPEAIEILIQRYKVFVRNRIKATYFIGADKDDLIQEGMIGLFKAICDYKPNKETTFRSFASICITRQISTAFKTATRQKHMPLNTSISLNLPVAGDEEDTITLMDILKGNESQNPEVMMIDKEDVEYLKGYMRQSLSDLEWRVLALHTEGKNCHEIAKDMDKSTKSVDNALQRIKRKLSELYKEA